AAAAPAAAPAPAAGGTTVHSTFAGTVEVVDIPVKVGDAVKAGQVVAAVEAMKAKYEIKSPRDGQVQSIGVKVGDEIDSKQTIMTIG
ncbi:MAG: acetyl-CoA carboxylase biotin carboxyl carrier protein subunit, partial [Krumholzibacteria bacterium]|nr:acetyl-CoA carboxylase biotin carboxyl carrier protein subunit [Candidatus Krumholzibacteria bacterium]